MSAINEFVNVIAAFSLSTALIQSRDESKALYDTTFALSAVFGGVSLVAAILAAIVLGMYRSPRAGWFLVVLGLCRLLLLLSWAPAARLERSLSYGRIAAIGMISGNIPNLVSLGLAWCGFGPWSLLLREALAAATMLSLSLWWSGYRFQGRVERLAASRLMSFARPMFVARSLDIVLQRFDRLMIGAWMGDFCARVVSPGPVPGRDWLLVAQPVTQLTFNLYSRVQDDSERLSRSYGIANYFLVRASFAGALCFLLCPRETILLLLGPQWLPSAPILRWLAPYAAIIPILDNLRWLLYARGGARKNVVLRLLGAVVFVPGVLIALHFKWLEGVALALTAGTVLTVARAALYVSEVVGPNLSRLLLTPLTAAAVTIAAIEVARAEDWLKAAPSVVLPALPALLFTTLLVALEGRTIRSEIDPLRDQLRGQPLGGV